jgi:hypothetical protein
MRSLKKNPESRRGRSITVRRIRKKSESREVIGVITGGTEVFLRIERKTEKTVKDDIGPGPDHQKKAEVRTLDIATDRQEERGRDRPKQKNPEKSYIGPTDPVVHLQRNGGKRRRRARWSRNQNHRETTTLTPWMRSSAPVHLLFKRYDLEGGARCHMLLVSTHDFLRITIQPLMCN